MLFRGLFCNFESERWGILLVNYNTVIIDCTTTSFNCEAYTSVYEKKVRNSIQSYIYHLFRNANGSDSGSVFVMKE